MHTAQCDDMYRTAIPMRELSCQVKRSKMSRSNFLYLLRKNLFWILIIELFVWIWMDLIPFTVLEEKIFYIFASTSWEMLFLCCKKSWWEFQRNGEMKRRRCFFDLSPKVWTEKFSRFWKELLWVSRSILNLITLDNGYSLPFLIPFWFLYVIPHSSFWKIYLLKDQNKSWVRCSQ